MKTAIYGVTPSFRPGVANSAQAPANRPARTPRAPLELKPAEFRLFHAWRP